MTREAASIDVLGAEQLRLIGAARSFLKGEQERGIDTAVHPECYLPGWSNVLGNARLLSLARQSGSTWLLVYRRLKEALNVIRHANWTVVGVKPIAPEIDQLVISWCRGTDFDESGEYRDRYFRTSSRATPRTLWFSLATDANQQAPIDSNVRVLRKRAGAARFSPTMLVRECLRSLERSRSTGRLPLVSATSTFADRVVNAVKELLAEGRFRELVTPYEAQPFQHAVYRAAKSFDPGLRTVGYLHSALPPVPADLTYREGAPDLLLVHGAGQMEILVGHLGWPAERVRVIPALRYHLDDDASLSGFIFLPMDFSAPDVLVAEFRAFVSAAAPASLSPLVVRNHPVMAESGKHLDLVRRLETVLADHADRFSAAKGEPMSVFIGVTAAIVEALERGVSVVHICSRPLTEAHTRDLWPRFEVERFGNRLFRYRMRDRGAYISFGSETDMFDKYIREGGSR